MSASWEVWAVPSTSGCCDPWLGGAQGLNRGETGRGPAEFARRSDQQGPDRAGGSGRKRWDSGLGGPALPGERKKDGPGEKQLPGSEFYLRRAKHRGLQEPPWLSKEYWPGGKCAWEGNWPGGKCAWDRNRHQWHTKKAEGTEMPREELEGEAYMGVRPPWSQTAGLRTCLTGITAQHGPGQDFAHWVEPCGSHQSQWHWVEAGPAQRRPGDFPSTSPWPRGSRGSSGSPGLASTPAAPAHNSPGPSAQPCCTREGGRTLGCRAALASIGNTCSGGWGHGISHAGRPPAPMPLLPAGHTWGLSRALAVPQHL